MAFLRLTLLGGFEARPGSGAPVHIPIRKAQGLLAYLALHPGKSIPREKLAALLWSERDSTQAHNSLRQTLTLLRKALEPIDPSPLVVDRNSATLDTAEVDAVEFLRGVESGESTDVEAAVALYAGDFLDGLVLRDPAFEAWAEEQRRQLREALHQGLMRLLEQSMGRGAWEESSALARRLLTLDPLQEGVHRALMRIHAETGRREVALQQYKLCHDLLNTELGVAPEPETEALYQALREARPSGQDSGIAAKSDGDSPTEPEALGAEPAPLVARGLSTEYPTAKPVRSWRLPALAAAVVLAAMAGTLGWLRPWQPRIEPASKANMAYPLPDKPSIAVLPFASFSDDPEQDYFADGLTEDIITTLSKIPTLFVIARNSTYTYKDKPVRVQQVAEEMGVRYVLEGSVRRADGRVRITAQLVDAIAGHHVWAGRYDRENEDFFDLQDELTLNIVRALQVELTEGEHKRVQLGRGTDNLEVWGLAMRGHALLRRITKQDNARAQEMLERAIALDPRYATAWSFLAWTHLNDARWGWGRSRGESFRMALETAEKALALDTTLADTYAVLGSIGLIERDHDRAIAYMEQALGVEPNGADHMALLAWALTYASRPAEAAALLERAMRLSPYYPAWYLVTLGRAYRLAGRYDDAITALKRAEERAPGNFHMHVVLAVIYSELERRAEARAKVADILKIKPGYTVSEFAKAVPYKDPAEFSRIRIALRKAGLPE